MSNQPPSTTKARLEAAHSAAQAAHQVYVVTRTAAYAAAETAYDETCATTFNTSRSECHTEREYGAAEMRAEQAGEDAYDAEWNKANVALKDAYKQAVAALSKVLTLVRNVESELEEPFKSASSRAELGEVTSMIQSWVYPLDNAK